MLQKTIETQLAQYQDQYLGCDLFAAKAIKRIAINENQVQIDITLGYPIRTVQDKMLSELHALLSPIVENKNVALSLNSSIDSHTGFQGLKSLPNIKNIIAIASGKGGVGKSTIAANLALALSIEGVQVGLLDADIYGPSQPMLLGAEKEKPVFKNGQFLPVNRYGIQSMSMGYLIGQQTPMIWRGPMIGKALQQLLQDTLWHDLDYLIVDLPPGTGDVQLTLCQKIPISGSVLITTPQDLALLDVRRACEMFNKLNVPILGFIENMSSYRCPKCNHDDTIFGSGGGAKLAQEYRSMLLANIPLDSEIRERTDQGEPPIVKTPDGYYGRLFGELARKVAAQVSLQPKDYSSKFPKVVVK